jgi:hypothetical protein
MLSVAAAAINFSMLAEIYKNNFETKNELAYLGSQNFIKFVKL